MNQSDDIIIGEFFPQPVKGLRAFVSIYAHHPIHGVISLFNEQVENLSKESFDLCAEGDALELQIKDLRSGQYTAKILIKGHEYDRILQIDHG